LRDEVAVHIDDPYVRAQAQAAAELLAHLAEHVEWRCDQLRTEIDAARAVLGTDAERAATIIGNHELISIHDALLADVAALQRSSAAGDDPADAELARGIDAFVRGYHATELERFSAARRRARGAGVKS